MYRLVVIDDEYIVVQGIKALISRLKLDYEGLLMTESRDWK